MTIKEKMRSRGICVVMPTYNNVGSIKTVVDSVLDFCDDVIVVNDGSNDSTAEALETTRQTEKGLSVISYAQNKGKGYALKVGFREALRRGFAYAVTVDADGQHYAKDIQSFLEANMEWPGSLVVGVRNMDGVERSKGSDFANKFSNFWFYVQTGKWLDDTQTGFRLYPLKKLRGLSLMTSRYEAELELLVFASWHGVKLHTVPIDVYYPPRGERVSHFRPVTDFIRIFILNSVLCVLAVVYGLPCRLYRWIEKVLRTAYSLFVFLFFMLVVMTPAVWVYLHIGKMTEKKRFGLHKLIYRAARFVTLRHGIPGTKFSYGGFDNADFDKPAVIICNHQSHLDLICKLIFTPKMVFLTNDWVWNNPFYSFIIRHAEFLPVANGIDEILPQLRSLRDRGYNIAVYPEGTRSVDCRIGRFHKGAFYIAKQLGMDIQPMILYGPGKVLPKKGRSLNKGPLHVEIMPRIDQAQLAIIGDEREQTKYFHKYYVQEYSRLCDRIEQDV